MWLDDIVPVNDGVDGPELFNSSFNLTEESFDFTVSLRMFYTNKEVIDVVMIQEFPEGMVSMFTVSS